MFRSVVCVHGGQIKEVTLDPSVRSKALDSRNTFLKKYVYFHHLEARKAPATSRTRASGSAVALKGKGRSISRRTRALFRSWRTRHSHHPSMFLK